MKILLGHAVHRPGVDKWYQEIARSAIEELAVSCFCLTLNPPGPRLSWRQLDRLWKLKDRKLMKMYERLQEAAVDCDVLINYNGLNIHPEFLAYLPTFNVFCCFDDPESSTNLSAPVAANYDAVFYGNIASRFQYESWGCKRIAWLPIFTAPSDVPANTERRELFERKRDIDVSFVGEKNHWRRNRLEKLAHSFPQARCYGKGWDSGYVASSVLKSLYSRTKIGWNVHNSTGPINRRLFTLAGFGILPICDNKTGLGHIFELGCEAIGFDTIPEAIEATNYYLNNEVERLEIAQNAYHRFWRDYQSEAIWQRIFRQLGEWMRYDQSDETRLAKMPSRHLVVDLVVPTIGDARRFARRTLNFIRRSSELARNKKSSYRINECVYLGEKVKAYHENPELKGVNMAQDRLSSGHPLDWPNILALNWAVTSLIGQAKRIVEIGSGTGPFAEFASVDPERTIHCFEEDDFARNQAKEFRSRDNVHYHKHYEDNLASYYDLLVSVEVIEHVANLKKFLNTCAGLAPRAIFTTPNRLVLRGADDIGPPPYAPHVRDFDPGELYWILKLYYREVYLYHLPDVYVPWMEPMTIATSGTPIIAECFKPV